MVGEGIEGQTVYKQIESYHRFDKVKSNYFSNIALRFKTICKFSGLLV